MPEPTVMMWVLQLTDCPDTNWAVAIGAGRFGGVFTSAETPPGTLKLLVSEAATRQAVHGFTREVERTVGGSAVVVGKEPVPASLLHSRSEHVRLAELRAAVANLLLNYDATAGEALEALTWLIDEITEKFGDELDDDDVGPIDPLNIN